MGNDGFWETRPWKSFSSGIMTGEKWIFLHKSFYRGLEPFFRVFLKKKF